MATIAMRLVFPTALASAFLAGVAGAALPLNAAFTGGPVRTEAARGSGLPVTIDVGGAPSSLVATPGAVWVSLGLDGVARIDPATNRVVARIRPGGTVVALAAGFGSIWALDLLGDRLLRIDPASNEVEGVTKVGGLPSGLAVGHGSVWVASQLDASVTRVAPQTGRVLATTKLGSELWPGAIAVAAGGVWVVTGGGNEVSRIDPRTGTVDIRLPVRGGRSLAIAGGAVWVGLAGDNRLLRINGAGMTLVDLPGHRANGYGPELAGGTELWLALPGRVARVVPAGGPRLRLPKGSHISAIAFAEDVWLAEQDEERVVRFALESAP